MHYAPFDGRKHTSDVVQDSSALECAERKLCASPEIKRTNLDPLIRKERTAGSLCKHNKNGSEKK